ncbi:MAG: hypothetical protein RR454_06050 [Clostridia bacterium]
MPTYKFGNGKKTHFKHFVETQDNDKAPIKVGAKFKQNPKKYDLSKDEVESVKKNMLESSKQKEQNNDKINKLKGK